MDMKNLVGALKAVGVLAIGTGVAALFGMIAVILVGVFAEQVALGNIPVSSAVNTSVQTIATNTTAAVLVIIGLLSLVAGLASIVIIVLALLGKVNFAAAAGVGGNKKSF